MGGSNPYIEEVKYKPATKKYKVTFLPSGKTIEVDPEKIPYGHNGIPGSILDISEGIKAGLDHACGGVCACSTCHVIVREGLESCNDATDAELDELDEAPGITPKSRLGCQTVPDGTTDIVVEIRSEEHTSELQSHSDLVCRLLLEKKKKKKITIQSKRKHHTYSTNRTHT